jgi:hypothetical protein
MDRIVTLAAQRGSATRDTTMHRDDKRASTSDKTPMHFNMQMQSAQAQPVDFSVEVGCMLVSLRPDGSGQGA